MSRRLQSGNCRQTTLTDAKHDRIKRLCVQKSCPEPFRRQLFSVLFVQSQGYQSFSTHKKNGMHTYAVFFCQTLVEWEAVIVLDPVRDIHEAIPDAVRGSRSGAWPIGARTTAIASVTTSILAVSELLIIHNDISRVDFLAIPVCIAACLDPS